jgi:hypothetical protein
MNSRTWLTFLPVRHGVANARTDSQDSACHRFHMGTGGTVQALRVLVQVDTENEHCEDSESGTEQEDADDENRDSDYHSSCPRSVLVTMMFPA